MLSPQALEVLRTLPPKSASDSEDLEQIQKDHDAWENSLRLERRYEPWTHNDRTWYQRIGDAASRTLIVYAHGGGFVSGSARTHQVLCENLAREARACVANVNYPLAPRYPYPCAVEDLVGVYRALESGFGSVVLAGDSAGGCLVLQAYLRLVDLGARLPDKLVLLSPWLDLELSKHQDSPWEDLDPLVSLGGLQRCARLYTQGSGLSARELSPCFASKAAFPPTLILVGSREMLKLDAYQLRDNNPGSPIQVSEYEGLWHVWPAWGGLPEAAQALAEIGQFVRGQGPNGSPETFPKPD